MVNISKIQKNLFILCFSDTCSGLTTPRVRARRSPIPTTKSVNSWKPWKRKELKKHAADKLLIPLPIPHPVHIAISIYNRDSEHPIPTESDICWDILRSIEECQGDLEAILRFRASGGEGNRSIGISVDGLAAIDSSMDSLDSQNSSNSGTKDSMDMIAGASETLPCTNREVTIIMPSTVMGANEMNNGMNSGSEQVNTDREDGEETPNVVPSHFHWTLSNWGGGSSRAQMAAAARRRNTSFTYNSAAATVKDDLNTASSISHNDAHLEQIRVDLASPEDISLDTDSSRAVFSAAYGTTV